MIIFSYDPANIAATDAATENGDYYGSWTPFSLLPFDIPLPLSPFPLACINNYICACICHNLKLCCL